VPARGESPPPFAGATSAALIGLCSGHFGFARAVDHAIEELGSVVPGLTTSTSIPS